MRRGSPACQAPLIIINYNNSLRLARARALGSMPIKRAAERRLRAFVERTRDRIVDAFVGRFCVIDRTIAQRKESVSESSRARTYAHREGERAEKKARGREKLYSGRNKNSNRRRGADESSAYE